MIDIVGMRKKGKVYELIEKYFVLCVLKVIECLEVVLVVIDVE